MINISNLAKQYGPQLLFSDVTLELVAGQRYGLVGANGSGKSTFLRILTGDEHADEGQISFGKQVRLGVLRQDQFAEDEARILDVAMRGDAEVFSALREVDRLSHEPEPDPHRIAELNDFIARSDGYTLETRAREILVGLGIPNGKLTSELRTLSGGFKLRVLLAQVLVGRPEALLLDEPTNHLDILSIRWLEQFLQGFSGCAVVISHDRRFLDAICTRMLDVDYDTITDYHGNYTAFLKAKALAATQKESEAARVDRIIAEKRAFVERFKAKATKAKQAQSRVKQLEKIETIEIARTSRRAPLFRFEVERASGKDVLTIEAIQKSYGERRVLRDVSFQIRRGERVAIIGENGIGKSTLLKIITSHLAQDHGKYAWGVNTKVGYFAQDHHELLNDPKLTPLDFVWNSIPSEATSFVRGQLGRMLFTGDEVEKKVTNLSGGEAARLIFTRIIVDKPNVLILDEPTNHLDLESIEALAESLEKYEGTLIFVSHDRWFVSRLASRVIELKPDGLHDFQGTYEEYLDKQGADHLDIDAVSLKAKQEKSRATVSVAPPSEAGNGAPLSYEDRKKKTNRLKTLPKKRDEILALIEQLEQQKTELVAAYSEPGFFEKTTQEELKLHKARELSLAEQVTEKMNEWEQVETEIEELGRELG